MIKEVNQACKRLNEKLGISVTLPNPGKKALRNAAACNLIAGASLIAAWVLLPSRCCAVLGGIGLVSSAVLRNESGRKNKP